MINYTSKKTNVIFYLVATLISAAFIPVSVDSASDTSFVIGGILGQFSALIAFGLCGSFVIYLIRLIFNKDKKFVFFMNVIWCTTFIIALFSTAGKLMAASPKRLPMTDHLSTALIYNLGYIIIALFFYYKRNEALKADVPKVDDLKPETQDKKEEAIVSEKSWLERFLSMESSPKKEVQKKEESPKKTDFIREKVDISRILGFWEDNPKNQTSKQSVAIEESVDKVDYYYADGTTPVGPISLTDLKKTPITPETKVWKTGLPDWIKANDLPELQSHFKSCPPPLR